MGARHYWIAPGETTWTEVVASIEIEEWQTKESAEEGTAPLMRVIVYDPDMVYDFVGHRPWRIIEDQITDGDDIIYQGYIATQEISRGEGAKGEPLGRVWALDISDANTLWARRAMLGADCNRPAETDVERMQWLLGTNEAAAFDDITTYVSTDDPVDMDKNDYRGQMFNQIADDCAQQSGKNWYAWVMWSGSAYEVFAWYGDDSLTDFSSTLSLTNDLDDLVMADIEDGTSLYWPISRDTKLARDPSRVFSGAVVPYDGGYAYAVDDDTADTYARRDSVQPAANVKTATKAKARARRYVNSLDEQDERITTSVEVPAALVNQLRQGMRIPYKATHQPGYEDYVWCRILNRALQQIYAGSWYRVTLELAGPKGAAASGGGTGVFATLDAAEGPFAANLIRFVGSGDSPPGGWWVQPTLGLLTILSDTVVPSRAYYGIQVDGDGTVDLYFFATTVGVMVGTYTIVWAITVNDAVVASVTSIATGHLQGYGGEATVTASAVPVSSGDVIKATVGCTPPMPMFKVPHGIGTGGRLTVTGGSLS